MNCSDLEKVQETVQIKKSSDSKKLNVKRLRFLKSSENTHKKTMENPSNQKKTKKKAAENHKKPSLRGRSSSSTRVSMHYAINRYSTTKEFLFRGKEDFPILIL